MKAKRKRHDATFKSRVALEALKGTKTIQEIAKDYEVHPVQVSDWKKTLVERIPEVFERRRGGTGGSEEFTTERNELHSKIGELGPVKVNP